MKKLLLCFLFMWSITFLWAESITREKDGCFSMSGSIFYECGQSWSEMYSGTEYMCMCNCASVGVQSCKPKTNSENVSTGSKRYSPQKTYNKPKLDLGIKVNELNEYGLDEYDNGNYQEAINYFQKALEYDPYNYDVKYNIDMARKKANFNSYSTNKNRSSHITIPSYLSSISTSLEIASISQHLMIFHPSPRVRLKAQKKMLEDTMNKISEETANFIMNEKIKQDKLYAFKYESEYEKKHKRNEAIRYGKIVEELRYKSYIEAKYLANKFSQSDISNGKIKVISGKSMSELFRIANTGKW